MTTRPRFAIALGVVLVLSPWAPASVVGQEESVKPGINDQYVDPSVDQWVPILESEQRAIYAYRDAIVEALDLEPGSDVADVGAGTGFLTRMAALEVAPAGTVYAVDIARTFLDHIEERAAAEGLGNIRTVLADQRSTGLDPASVDLVLVCDTYHHFEYPESSLDSIRRALRPDGRLVVIDFERIVGVSTSFALEHVRAGKGTVTDEIKDAGFDLVAEIPVMQDEGQYFLVFEKRDP